MYSIYNCNISFKLVDVILNDWPWRFCNSKEMQVIRQTAPRVGWTAAAAILLRCTLISFSNTSITIQYPVNSIVVGLYNIYFPIYSVKRPVHSNPSLIFLGCFPPLPKSRIGTCTEEAYLQFMTLSWCCFSFCIPFFLFPSWRRQSSSSEKHSNPGWRNIIPLFDDAPSYLHCIFCRNVSVYHFVSVSTNNTIQYMCIHTFSYAKIIRM